VGRSNWARREWLLFVGAAAAGAVVDPIVQDLKRAPVLDSKNSEKDSSIVSD
jgi:hypothetical protein